MDDLTQLQERFSIPGVLAFQQHGELVRVEVHTATAEAVLYLQGAHLTHWQPQGEEPVLFLSPESEFAPGKAIRGGVPVIFPWFGARADGGPGPSHGFARTAEWTMSSAALAGDDLHLALTLEPTEESRGLGFDGFHVIYQLSIGATLRLRLTVVNEGRVPLRFEEALHTYFAVADVREATVAGLEEGGYLDKVQGGREVSAARAPLQLGGPTDRVYEATQVDCILRDPVGGRTLRNQKTNSMTTVVWNPWKAMADLGEEAWPRMLCVETANTGADAITLGAGEAHTMEAHVAVERMQPDEVL